MRFRILALVLVSWIFAATGLAGPTITSFLNMPNDPRGIDVSGIYAYVADGEAGLHVVDISDSSNPIIVGTVDTPGYAYGIAVSGSYAYVTEVLPGRVQVIDIRDPFNPSITASLPISGYAYGIAVSGSYAYVVVWETGLVILDVSNPSNPIIIASLSKPYLMEVFVNDTYAYVTGNDKDFSIVDISSPGNPTIVGSINTPGRTGGVFVSGTYAYVADTDTGFYVISIENPANPHIVGSILMAAAAREVYVSGSYAYVGGQNTGLNIVDITNPTNPIIVGSVGSPPYYPRAIDLSGSYAYVTDYDTTGLNPNRLYVINISEYVDNPLIANAGSDQLVFDQVILDGSLSQDPDGTIVAYEWNLQHRENPSYNKLATGLNPTISGLYRGFYDVTLTVTDNDGFKATDTMILAASGQCAGWPNPNADFDVNSFRITKNKRSGSTTTQISGIINLPALGLVNGDTVNSRITIELFGSLPGGGDLVVSEEAVLNVTETNKTLDIRK